MSTDDERGATIPPSGHAEPHPAPVLASSFDLAEFVSRFVPLHIEGKEKCGKCVFCDTGGHSLKVGDTAWRAFCCGAHELNGNDAPGFYACWTDSTRDEAIAKLGNGAGLPDAKPVEQRPLKRLPFWGWRDLDKPGLRDKAVWIHELSGAVLVWRQLVPERVHLGLISSRIGIWEPLSIVTNRRCVLVPENNPDSYAMMAGLAAALYRAGHKQVMCLSMGIDERYGTRELPEPGEDVLKWAKARSKAYPKPNGEAPHEAYEPHYDTINAAPQDNKAATIPVESPAFTPSSGSLPNTSGPAGAAPDNAAQAAQEAPPAHPDDPGAQAPAGTPKARKAPPDLALVDETGALRKPRLELSNEPEPLPAFSEFALASAFADGAGKDWRYTAAWVEWAKWNGVRWVPDEVKRITWEMRDCCTAVMNAHMADSTPLQRMRLTTLKTVNAVMALAGSDPSIAAAASQWDADPMLLGTPGGIVDLSTGQLVTADRSQMISRSTGVSPAVGAHPWWDRVLERAGSGMAGFLQLWCGYMLTGDTREERFLFIHGPGGGGKSKFMLVLSEILGDYRRTTKMESFTAQQRQEHSEEIARLAGARLVIATETDEGSRWNEARIKALTGRDAIAARHMHKSTFEFKPQFKLVFVGNHRPALRSVGEEMRRRIDLIEWGGTIPEADRVLDLPDKLRAEYPAILAWMIEGCLRWQREGLTKPESVKVSVADYIQGEDTLGAWLEESTDLTQGERTRTSAAYGNYKRWTESRGEYVLTQKRFTQALKDRGFAIIKSMGFPHFIDMQLKSSSSDDDYIPDSATWTPPER